MTIGIFYICTGKYSIFWNTFYDSCERLFMPGINKHYFVFTDSDDIKPTDNIHYYREAPKGFPLDSLYRFDMFLKIKQDTIMCDYLFFFNSNLQFIRKVTPDMILPSKEENDIIAVRHPGYYYENNAMKLPHEKHMRSTACIPYKKGDYYKYFMGGINGGTRDAYYRLAEVCSKNIHIDEDNNVLAIYHDESHLNRYVHGMKIKELTPYYGCPEDSPLYPNPYIIILNKMKHGGKYFDKLPTTSYGRRVVFYLKRLYWGITWKMGILK